MWAVAVYHSSMKLNAISYETFCILFYKLVLDYIVFDALIISRSVQPFFTSKGNGNHFV